MESKQEQVNECFPVHFSLWPLESADRLRKTSTVTLKQLD